MLPLIALGVVFLGGCGAAASSDDDDDVKTPEPGDAFDAGTGVDADTDNDTDTGYVDPDAGVPKADGDTPDAVVTKPPLEDKDQDGVFGCVPEDQYSGDELYSDFKKICDCNDQNKFIKPSTAEEYIAQRLVKFDTNCDGSLALDINKDAVKFVGFKMGDLGDVNHDGYADAILSAPHHSLDHGNEGAIAVFFGGPNKLKVGQSYTIEQADYIYYGGAGWSLGSGIVAVPAYGDTNGDGKIDNSDYCDLMASAPGYNNGQSGGVAGDGSGNSEDGKSAIVTFRGGKNWQHKYNSTYDISNLDNENIVNVFSEQSLGQNKMGIIKSTANGLNISYGQDFDKDGMPDVILAETSAQKVHLIPGKEYLGINWMEDVRTLWINDLNIGSGISLPGSCKIEDVTGDGNADLILADSSINNSAGRIYVVKNSGSTPEYIEISGHADLQIECDGQPCDYFTYTGELSGDTAGNSIIVADLDGDNLCDLSIGASNDSGPMAQAGKIYTLFTEEVKKSIQGQNPSISIDQGTDIILDGDVEKLNGRMIAGDANEAYLATNSAMGAADLDGDSKDELFVGAQFHPQSPRAYVADMLSIKLQSAYQVLANTLDQVLIGDDKFGAIYSHGADTEGTGAESILIGAPEANNNKGIMYLFAGVTELTE